MNENIYTNGEYVKSNPGYHVEDSPWKAKQIKILLDQNELLPEDITEIGCGAGGVLYELQKLMPEKVTFRGYEISPEGYLRCQKLANSRLTYYCEDFIKSPAKTEVLLCIDVFEHVDDYIGFIKNIKGKALYKIFHIPLDLSVQALLRKRPIMNIRKDVGHLHYFFKDTALETLKYAGLEILDWRYTPSCLELRKGFLAKLLKFPRILLSAVSPDFSARVLGGYSIMVLTK